MRFVKCRDPLSYHHSNTTALITVVVVFPENVSLENACLENCPHVVVVVVSVLSLETAIQLRLHRASSKSVSSKSVRVVCHPLIVATVVIKICILEKCPCCVSSVIVVVVAPVVIH